LLTLSETGIVSEFEAAADVIVIVPVQVSGCVMLPNPEAKTVKFAGVVSMAGALVVPTGLIPRTPLQPGALTVLNTALIVTGTEPLVIVSVFIESNV
jgi:hypothetical protein